MTTATMTSHTGFTSSFVDRIATSRRRLDQYIETNQQKADQLIAKLKSTESTEQSKIDSLLRQLKSLQYERGVAEAASGADKVTGLAEQRKKLQNKQAKLQQEVEMLQAKNRIEQSRLEEVLTKEKEVRRQAQEARARKIEIEAQKNMTVEDLTNGLLHYKYTGMSFVRGENGALDFKFTRLDHNQPDRPFTFTLALNEDTDLFEITNCNPRLDQNKVDEVNDVANANENGLHNCAVRMRKLFKETL